jgi:hypothetical protein
MCSGVPAVPSLRWHGLCLMIRVGRSVSQLLAYATMLGAPPYCATIATHCTLSPRYVMTVMVNGHWSISSGGAAVAAARISSTESQTVHFTRHSFRATMGIVNASVAAAWPPWRDSIAGMPKLCR